MNKIQTITQFYWPFVFIYFYLCLFVFHEIIKGHGNTVAA